MDVGKRGYFFLGNISTIIESRSSWFLILSYKAAEHASWRCFSTGNLVEVEIAGFLEWQCVILSSNYWERLELSSRNIIWMLFIIKVSSDYSSFITSFRVVEGTFSCSRIKDASIVLLMALRVVEVIQISLFEDAVVSPGCLFHRWRVRSIRRR